MTIYIDLISLSQLAFRFRKVTYRVTADSCICANRIQLTNTGYN